MSTQADRDTALAVLERNVLAEVLFLFLQEKGMLPDRLRSETWEAAPPGE